MIIFLSISLNIAFSDFKTHKDGSFEYLYRKVRLRKYIIYLQLALSSLSLFIKIFYKNLRAQIYLLHSCFTKNSNEMNSNPG